MGKLVGRNLGRQLNEVLDCRIGLESANRRVTKQRLILVRRIFIEVAYRLGFIHLLVSFLSRH